MRVQITSLSLCALLTAVSASAKQVPESQPPIWADKPNVSSFEAKENAQLAAAKAAIDKLLAVKGQRTVDNTLASYDEALRNIDSASKQRGQVHLILMFG